MKKRLSRKLRRAFDARMRSRFPDFRKTNPGTVALVYERADACGLTFYLGLDIEQKAYRNSFSIVAGWSEVGEFPENAGQEGFQPENPEEGLEDAELVDGGVLFGIHVFMRSARLVHWNTLTGKQEMLDFDLFDGEPPDPDGDYTEECLDAAFAAIQEHVLPVFERVVAKRGSRA
jgi:hypothetical protein